MTPTVEQAAIIHAAKSTNESLLINALAGAAKTTTLVMLAHELPLQAMLCIAFNKRIADEMQKRMPGHVQCKTVNAVGHQVWGRVTGSRLTVDTKKNYTLLKEEFDRLPKEQRDRLGDAFSSILKAMGLAKSYGYVPKAFRTIGQSLIEDREELLDVLASAVDVELEDEHLDLLDTVLGLSITKAYKGYIDFDDQIYMSTLFGGSFPKFPLVMVDEAQDLSALNHEMVRKLVGDRLIAVGDPWQSIYSFRGAHSDSMSWLKDEFKMTELTLSVSFRCPRKIVELARWRVPHFKFREGAEEGEVTNFGKWDQSHINESAAILCRNNAPLFKCALKLIQRGRGVKLVGSELGPNLIKTLRKLGDPNMKKEQVHEAIISWEDTQIAKAREARKASIRDRAECLRVFADFGATLNEAIAYAEHLFSATGTISLMTGHKAKGLEFDFVFWLDPWRIPSRYAREAAEAGDDRQLQQELNLKYVIQTRAKKAHYTMNLEDMQ